MFTLVALTLLLDIHNTMASVLKATNEIQRRKDKGKGKSKADEDTENVVTVKPRKDKVLLISSRGVTQRMRHLMNDLEALLPHTKKGKLATRIDKDSEADQLCRLQARFEVIPTSSERTCRPPLMLKHPLL